MPRIEQIYVYVAIDNPDDPDDEGVIAQMTPGGMMMPLIGADVERSDSIRSAAQNIATVTGKPVRLLKFSVREELEVIYPERQPNTRN